MNLKKINTEYFSFQDVENSSVKKWVSSLLQEAFSFINNDQQRSLLGELPAPRIFQIAFK